MLRIVKDDRLEFSEKLPLRDKFSGVVKGILLLGVEVAAVAAASTVFRLYYGTWPWR